MNMNVFVVITCSPVPNLLMRVICLRCLWPGTFTLGSPTEAIWGRGLWILPASSGDWLPAATLAPSPLRASPQPSSAPPSQTPSVSGATCEPLSPPTLPPFPGLSVALHWCTPRTALQGRELLWAAFYGELVGTCTVLALVLE